MTYKRSLIDIIDDQIGELNFTIEIESVALNEAGQTVITSCNIFHAQPGFSVSIDNVSYRITDINGSTQIILPGDLTTALTGVTSFDLYRPYFFHGTPLATNTELQNATNIASNKTPMFWLHEGFEEKFYTDQTITLERDSFFDLYALTQADHDNWLTDDAYHYAIEPMRRMAETLIQQMQNTPGIFQQKDFDYRITGIAKFDVTLTNKGTLKNLFLDNLSGVRIRFEPLKILKEYPYPCPC